MANMRMVVRGVKRNKLTVLGSLAVEISTGGITSYQILYDTEDIIMNVPATAGGGI